MAVPISISISTGKHDGRGGAASGNHGCQGDIGGPSPWRPEHKKRREAIPPFFFVGSGAPYRIMKLQRMPAQVAEPITPEALQAMACMSR